MQSNTQRPPVYDTKILPRVYTACHLWQNNAPDCGQTFHSLQQNNDMYLALTSPVVYDAVVYSAPTPLAINWITMLLTVHMDSPICPGFFIYISSGNTKKATALSEEHLPVHSKSNIILNISVYLSFMYVIHKKLNRILIKCIVTFL